MSRILDKDEVKAVVDALPDGATWADLLDEVQMRLRIERGLADAAAGHVATVEEVRTKYGLTAV